jgi:dTDP-4-amino-4,6-dideoxygalactose transaminase
MTEKNKKVFVTKPALAPLDEFIEYLSKSWDSSILSNNGPLVQSFEQLVAEKLGLQTYLSVTSGTIALQMAIKALDLKGEIITTPFTWVATCSAIIWENCTPVFVDIDPHTYNLDPEKVESAITENTVCILPVHVYGNPCDTRRIKEIATKYNLAVIYDAAHAMGTTDESENSILLSGSISATSTHATKILNTGEGGGCVTTDNDLLEKLKRIRYFGNNSSGNVVGHGFNGKMSEIHAALGLANIKYLDDILLDRKKKYLTYREKLQTSPKFSFQKIQHGTSNYAYFSIAFNHEKSLLNVLNELEANEIFPRRYFYPSVNKHKNIKIEQSMPISEDLSKRILCLPLYWQIEEENIERIVKIVVKSC